MTQLFLIGFLLAKVCFFVFAFYEIIIDNNFIQGIAFILLALYFQGEQRITVESVE